MAAPTEGITLEGNSLLSEKAMPTDKPSPENAPPGAASTNPWVDVGNAWASIVASWADLAEGWMSLMTAWAKASSSWMGPLYMGMNPFTEGPRAAASWTRQAMGFAAPYATPRGPPPGPAAQGKPENQARGPTPPRGDDPGDIPPLVDGT
jgi:hypothetical protein